MWRGFFNFVALHSWLWGGTPTTPPPRFIHPCVQLINFSTLNRIKIGFVGADKAAGMSNEPFRRNFEIKKIYSFRRMGRLKYRKYCQKKLYLEFQ